MSRPDGSVLVLDPATGQTRQTLHPLGADEHGSLAFAPDGTLATGTLGGIVQLWNPISGAQVAGPLAVTAGPVSSIAFDPTGQRFATTAGQDGAVKLWCHLHAPTGRRRAQHRPTRRVHRHVRAPRQRPARRQRPRQRLHLANVARRLGATRLHGRRTQPHPRGMVPIPPGACLHAGLSLNRRAQQHRTDPNARRSGARLLRDAFAQRHKPSTHTPPLTSMSQPQANRTIILGRPPLIRRSHGNRAERRDCARSP